MAGGENRLQKNSKHTQAIVTYGYWATSAMSLIGLWVYNFVDSEELGRVLGTVILLGLFVIYSSKLFSIVLEMLIREKVDMVFFTGDLVKKLTII